MTISRLKAILTDCCNDIIFMYKGVQSGITVTVHDYVPTYQVWFGDKIKEYDEVDSVVNDKFYGGKSLSELVNIVDFNVI